MTTFRTETITAADGGEFSGLAALPDAGTGSGILLIQEIFGVGEFVREKAGDLAALGYVVLAPDAFWRIGRDVALGHDEASLGQAFGRVQEYNRKVPAALQVDDLVVALRHLRGMPEVEGKVAAMGYCWGGSMAYEVAAAADPDACVSYYGSTVASRLSVADQITCPVIFHYGGADPYISADQPAAVEAAFADRDDVSVHVHLGAGHAFENNFAPQFWHPDAAAASWALTTDFLRRALAP